MGRLVRDTRLGVTLSRVGNHIHGSCLQPGATKALISSTSCGGRGKVGMYCSMNSVQEQKSVCSQNHYECR